MLSSPKDFFSVMAQVAVSLLALLFVSFQIARDRWIKSEERKILAIQTSFEFMTVLLFSLGVILPNNPLVYRGIEIKLWQIIGIIIGVIGLIVAFWFIAHVSRHPENKDIFVKNQMRWQLLAIVDYLAILLWSLFGQLPWVSIWMIWMLCSASIETWWFFSEPKSKGEKKGIK